MAMNLNQTTDTITPTTTLLNVVGSDLVLPKTSGKGIKVDTTTPTFGWRDLLGAITVRGTGSADPSWNVYRTNIRQYQFGVNDECWSEFHIPHDYLPASDIYIHAHWSLTDTTVETVTWGFDVTYAKGHQQAAFPATINTTVAQASTGTAYTHMIGEVQLSATTPSGSQIDSDDLEVDGLILVRTYLSANSGATEPFLHFVDIHYQSTNMATKNKAPGFYT